MQHVWVSPVAKITSQMLVLSAEGWAVPLVCFVSGGVCEAVNAPALVCGNPSHRAWLQPGIVDSL